MRDSGERQSIRKLDELSLSWRGKDDGVRPGGDRFEGGLASGVNNLSGEKPDRKIGADDQIVG